MEHRAAGGQVLQKPSGLRSYVLVLVLLAVFLSFCAQLLQPEPMWPFPWLDWGALASFVMTLILGSASVLYAYRHFRQPQVYVEYVLVLQVCLLISVGVRAFSSFWRPEPLTWYWVGRMFLMSALVGGVIMRFLWISRMLRLKERAELNARIQSLQSRIRPHFLFNCMNMIASLIPVQPDKAEEAVVELSHLFRSALREVVEVRLAEELALCRAYLHLESLRLGDRLQVEWQMETADEEMAIPLLTLQPILENAIYHGVERCLHPEPIRIILCCRRGVFSAEIRNPVADMDYDQLHRQGHHMALQNIRERMYAHHGEQARLKISSDRKTFITYVSFPARRLSRSL